ncbi:FecR family protein [Parabacteroides timonensis]|uniref:FecR family protein n=1 Tax=Parabacteroides timonensis TaxID=1871013 RepID=UPI00094F287E|nr:FecR domain-containing protein [Parabacteroides timonensis]
MDKEILQQYIEGKLDQQQKEEVARWLDANEKNMKEFLMLRGIYDAILWNEPEQKSFLSLAKRIRLFREFLKIAAIFILAFGSFYFLVPRNEKFIEPEIEKLTVYVPEGQWAKIFLTDGTKVWLNAKTSLSFPNRFISGERRVELDGEAYFEVKKDTTRHFIVSCKDYQVKVLGTEFNIKAYRQNDYFETALMKGSVEVESTLNHEKVLLTPKRYVYTKDGKLMSANLKNIDQFLWREGIIAFENESVKSIFCKLELYYDVKIEVKNTRILDYPYTGKFRTKDGVEHVLRVLQLQHKFAYTRDNAANVIVIK